MPKTLPSLAQVDSYPVPELLVPRIMKNYKRSQEFAEAIVREAKRMLLLHHASHEPICPSIEIDDAWHEMMLFTRFYQEFCAFLGGFVDHEPEPEGDVPTNSGGTSVYDLTLRNYQKYFGVEPDQRYWTP